MKQAEIEWEDCCIGFKCPKCGESNVADTKDGYEKCECGIEYALSAKLIFKQETGEA